MGCGCGSNFSGQTEKKCSCGRNEGGSCQCNENKINASGSAKAMGRKDKMMNFHHSKSNFSSKQVGFEDVQSRFNSFMGITTQPQVDIKKYNIPQDEFYAYNDYYSGMGGASTRSGGFTQWNKNDDLEVQF